MFSNIEFWTGRKVLITGHTGFKGSWLCLWLHALGARIAGYALDPPTKPSLFELARVEELVEHNIGDVRDLDHLQKVVQEFDPEVVFHMAAQPLVRESYRSPVETYSTNVMGTIHLLEAVRCSPGVRAVVNVTTDKCYENREWVWGYREGEPLGGFDPYSSSKACSELVTAAWRQSFFPAHLFGDHGVALASARAGNVIGGGDWAEDRLVPDCIQSLLNGDTIRIRNPNATRPWQYVLEPLHGYMLLALRLCQNGPDYASAWNFGPNEKDARPVEWFVERLCMLWGDNAKYSIEESAELHEAKYLKLDCSKARSELGWEPVWTLDRALEGIVSWVHGLRQDGDARQLCLNQIQAYQADIRRSK